MREAMGMVGGGTGVAWWCWMIIVVPVPARTRMGRQTRARDLSLERVMREAVCFAAARSAAGMGSPALAARATLANECGGIGNVSAVAERAAVSGRARRLRRR